MVASAFKEDAERRLLPADQVPDGWMGLDIGPETARLFGKEIRAAKIVLWNGPMGVFEMKPFAEGTLAVARALADGRGTTVVGGGDSVAAVNQMGLADKIDHVSTGGGASLEFLAGDPLPGVACLEEREPADERCDGRVIAGNWKMYKTISAAQALVREIAEGVGAKPAVEVVVFPPFTALPAAVEAARGTAVKVGAQNMHFENEGAFTGEVSPLMLKDAGATHVVLGHSERRHVFGEDDELVAKKTRAAVKAGLVPIVCVGETLPERESGRTLEVVERQLERALRSLGADELGRSIVAYEPVWAIGTGKVGDPRAGPGGPRLRAEAHRRHPRRPRGRRDPDPLRRQREAGQHQGAHGPAGRGRGPGRRGLPGRGVLPEDRPLPGLARAGFHRIYSAFRPAGAVTTRKRQDIWRSRITSSSCCTSLRAFS